MTFPNPSFMLFLILPLWLFKISKSISTKREIKRGYSSSFHEKERLITYKSPSSKAFNLLYNNCCSECSVRTRNLRFSWNLKIPSYESHLNELSLLHLSDLLVLFVGLLVYLCPSALWYHSNCDTSFSLARICTQSLWSCLPMFSPKMCFRLAWLKKSPPLWVIKNQLLSSVLKHLNSFILLRNSPT